MADIDALLAELESGSDRAATIAVLADALVERGEPRGELIHVERALATADGPERGALEQRAQELVGELRARVLGPLASHPEIVLEYRDGFIHRASVTESPEPYSMGDALAVIAASPDARFLHTIAIDPTEEAEIERPIATVLERLRGVALPRSLQRLELGRAFERSAGYRVYRDWGQVAFSDNVSSVLDVFSDLAELRVDLGAVWLEWSPLVSSRLRRFSYVSPYVRTEELEQLAKSKLPALEAFELWTGSQYLVNEEMDLYTAFDESVYEDDIELEGEVGEGGEGNGVEHDREPDFDDHESLGIDDLEPVLAMLDTTPVRELTIANFSFEASALVRAIATHPFARQIARLDLSHGRIDRELAATAASLPALETLAIESIELTRAQLPTLQARMAEIRELRELERYRYVITME